MHASRSLLQLSWRSKNPRKIHSSILCAVNLINKLYSQDQIANTISATQLKTKEIIDKAKTSLVMQSLALELSNINIKL